MRKLYKDLPGYVTYGTNHTNKMQDKQVNMNALVCSIRPRMNTKQVKAERTTIDLLFKSFQEIE